MSKSIDDLMKYEQIWEAAQTPDLGDYFMGVVDSFVADKVNLAEKEARIDELTQILDGQLIKPQYHNALVGKITELRGKDDRD